MNERRLAGGATLARIRDLVAEEYGITARAVMSRRRPKEIARPRQLAMWLCREYTNLSYPQIGRFFDRDHTTVMHACKLIPELMAADPEFKKIAVKLGQRCEGKWYPPGQEEYIMGIWA